MGSHLLGIILFMNMYFKPLCQNCDIVSYFSHSRAGMIYPIINSFMMIPEEQRLISLMGASDQMYRQEAWLPNSTDININLYKIAIITNFYYLTQNWNNLVWSVVHGAMWWCVCFINSSANSTFTNWSIVSQLIWFYLILMCVLYFLYMTIIYILLALLFTLLLQLQLCMTLL